jgi:excisionase family DNA binding protein
VESPQRSSEGAVARAPARPSQTFYNVAETADLLRLDQSTLYRHLRSGQFPGVKIGGRYVVPRAVVERLINDVLTFGGCIDIADWAARWHVEQAHTSGGVA